MKHDPLNYHQLDVALDASTVMGEAILTLYDLIKIAN